MLLAWALSGALGARPVLPASRGLGPRPAPAAGTRPRDGVRTDPYPGLFDCRSCSRRSAVALTTLALGGLIFLVMPRATAPTRTRAGRAVRRHLTGFDDEVQLGPARRDPRERQRRHDASSCSTTDEPAGSPPRASSSGGASTHGASTRRPLAAAAMRRHPAASAGPPPPGRGTHHPPADQARADRHRLLFGLRPILDRAALAGQPIDGSPTRTRTTATARSAALDPGPTYDYEVVSTADPDVPQPGEALSRPHRLDDAPSDPRRASRSRLRAIAEAVVAAIPADDWTSAGPGAGGLPPRLGRSSATRCRWTWSTRRSTRSRTSWSTARRATASTSPAP